MRGALPRRPHQGALPLGTPPRAVALGTATLVGSLRGANRGLATSVLAPLKEPTHGQIAKGLALCGGSRRQPLLAGFRAEPCPGFRSLRVPGVSAPVCGRGGRL